MNFSKKQIKKDSSGFRRIKKKKKKYPAKGYGDISLNLNF